MPVTGYCPNINNNCEKADSKELLTVPDGSSPQCPECGTEISVQKPPDSGTTRKIVIAVAAGVIVAVLLYTFLQPSVPMITGPQSASGKVGQALEIRIEATKEPTSYGAKDLPPGLTLDSGTGVISGTPTEDGKFQITLTATNAAGESPAASCTLTIERVQLPSPVLPTITSPLTASWQLKQAFNYRIMATPQPMSYGATGLPPGLTVDTRTGQISGTPTEAKTFSVTLSATNAAGTGRATLTLTITGQEGDKDKGRGEGKEEGKGKEEKLATARNHFQQGGLFVGLGRTEEAVKEFSAAIESDPTYAPAYINRGTAYITQKKYNRALDDLTKAITLAPEDKNAFYNLAVLYTLQKQFDRAIDTLEKAIKLGFRDSRTLRSDPDLAELRKQPEFRKLIEKHEIPYVL